MAEAHVAHLEGTRRQIASKIIHRLTRSVGQANLVGAVNHWKMVIALRPHLFLVSVNIYAAHQDCLSIDCIVCSSAI